MKGDFAEVLINRSAQALERPFTYLVPPELAAEIHLGSVVRVPLGASPSVEGVVLGFPEEVPPELELRPILSLAAPLPLFDADMLALSQWMAEKYLCNRIHALRAMLPAGVALTGVMPVARLQRCLYPGKAQDLGRAKKQQALFDHVQAHPGVVREKALAAVDASTSVLQQLLHKGCLRELTLPLWDEGSGVRELPPLSPQQAEVLASIRTDWQKTGRPQLLFGVTGSGKTELYARLAADCIAAGKQVIVLVPEIALSPQTVEFFRRRLACPIAVLHSAMTGAERRQAWIGIAAGEYPLVIGARSAVFAPARKLGLIILDEEHEPSYKQENVPRFHARELALERCRQSGAMLLMGSATPSLESFHRAEQGEYHLLRLPERYGKSSLPSVSVLDMGEELRAGNRSMFSRRLLAEMRRRLERKEQTLLFLNRRGYHTFVSCRNCGHVLTCPHCQVSYTYHAENHRLRCHYCGQEAELPVFCPVCGSPAIRRFGTGTERVEASLRQLLPAARILRMDRDSVRRAEDYARFYQKMRDGEADVLIGTQMIGKGLDLPRLTLVGVLAADLSLRMPDFRAGERSFQLLTQVAGRAGRRETPGQVIIQTYSPDSEVIRASAAQDYERFYAGEDRMRKELGYPPYSVLIRILLSGPEEALCRQEAQRLRQLLDADCPETAQCLGPAPALHSKIKDQFRQQLLLSGPDEAALREWLLPALAEWEKEKEAKVQVLLDVDPLSID